jgi:hypothetical protein
MKLNKEELLNHLAARIEQHLAKAISLFQNQPEPVLLQPSATGGWSIAQCIDHLNSYGHFYLPRLKTALQSAKGCRNTVFESGWLGNYFTKMMEPSGKSYKALKGHIPNKDLNAHGVVAEFIGQQEELLALLRMAETRAINTRIPTSISPLVRLKAGDVFRFLIAHNERHVQQALRNLEM